MTEARATHRVKTTGDVVFPEGYDDSAIELLPEGYWEARDLADAKVCRWRLIKAARDTAVDVAQTPRGDMDADADSRGKINGAVLMAILAKSAGTPFSIEWTMNDNTVIAHDADEMIAAGVAVGRHVAACHAVGNTKREAIEAAETVDAVGNVSLDGWPG